MKEFIWNSRKVFRILFEKQVVFRLNRKSKDELKIREKTVSSKLLDLSAAGCALESSCFLPAGVKLNVFIDRNALRKSDAKKKDVSKIVGIVRTSRPLSGRKYRLGVEFEKVSSEDRALINSFVEAQERREDKRIEFPK